MNRIIIEFSAEDRARLDRIADLLERSQSVAINPADFEPIPEQTTEGVGSYDPTTADSPFPEQVEAPAPVKEEPKIELDQVRKRVTLLRAKGNKEQKDGAAAVVKKYAPNISGLPLDKLPEIWAQLEALGAVEG